VDPRLPQALQSALPHVWTVDSLQEQAEAAGTAGPLQRFVDELRATGMRSGVMLALPGPGEDRGYVSFLSSAADAQWIDDAVLGRVITFALCLHEFYSRWLPLPAPMEPAQAQAATDLSPLQLEILSLLAKGLADKQIADRLNLSLHNVDYHLRRLRRRFGVRNRVQLMQAAAR
jgi:DNA-binding CsgD family transcriptional regulator